MHVQYAKNLSPVGLLHTRMHMAAIVHAIDMYTRTGQRACERSVHVAHTSVEAMPKAVTPDG